MGAGINRWLMFSFMAAWTGVLAVFSIPGCIAAAVVAFGYGINCICEAIEDRK